MFSNPCPEGYYCGTGTSEIADYNFCDRGLYCPSASTSTGRTQNKCLSGFFCPLGTAAKLNSLGTFEYVYQIDSAYALEGTASYPQCTEDASLPQELIDLYIQNGTQLVCPEGTTSSRGAWCLGQCRSTSTSEIVDVFNPVNGSSTIDGEYNIAGEDTEYTERRMLNTNDPLDVDPYEYFLDPLYSATIYIDFTELPAGFTYNQHFRVGIIDKDGIELTLPNYFTESNIMTKKLELRIHNMKSYRQSFKFEIYLLHGLFSPYKEYLRNKVSVFLYYSKRATTGKGYSYGFLISETFLDGITIPYNAPDVENDQSFFLDMTADLGAPSQRGYDKDVHDSTYWQSRQITSAIMSWLPFFSNCERYDTKIIFYDLVEHNPE